MTVKSRKVSNATVLTIPSSFRIPKNVTFEPSMNDHGDIIFKRVDGLSDNRKNDIHDFMDRFKPVAEYLKDK
ncbi:Hypothetical protein ADU72_1237 [Pediococcus damnosus]|uniref:AbrB family transcriptional regulator n=1 Tax=Pediococcus damnosus TaxID=51663 RepID=A0AAC9FIZ3_9LACO|nr:hypothetical protein [Pediococcus damnosus]AMV60599.1 Hypothetical protein ADU69_0938 [Pediococcus damnosus]AMV62943.1 Hypothetical protein ADU70_1459 [Pediococcus damnosus]AMV64913.1 Hypothetical protein ADU71_1015 [Pediococcus damnosus]AMV67170.1 Hypothetical protein ADU72_1237 [Pediococcus damnosus]AMV69225.1 Hypothetical protein ADU73_0819 [Pediococcus damnosus]